jgi:hypothetical protein
VREKTHPPVNNRRKTESVACRSGVASSVDLYFGPKPPVAGRETNWIKTLPGKGWFTYFRLYAPTQPFFDRKWTLNDIEKMKRT